MTPEQAIETYYQLRKKHRRPIPRRKSVSQQERDERAMVAFLKWCALRLIDDPVGYMAERFRSMYLASKRRAVPRITQLANDALAERWSGWIEGERISDASYAARMARDDSFALHVKSLAAEPHVTKEAFKQRHELVPEACMTQLRWSGGYHPSSDWCKQCLCSAQCAKRINAEHGFDVVALRSGRVDKLPERVASALVR